MRINEVATYSYIEETSQLFQALALRHTMLVEGQLDEAGVWDIVKGTVGGVMKGIKTADDAINKLGRLVQQTKPVEEFDTKVDAVVADLKQKLGAKSPKAVATAEKYAAWAKEHPIKQGLIIGALTAIAALAVGPGAAAAAGFILRATNEYMKGEKASTAIGKGVKSAAVGAALGALANAAIPEIGEMFKLAKPILKDVPGYNALTTFNATYIFNGNPLVNISRMMDDDSIKKYYALTKELDAALTEMTAWHQDGTKVGPEKAQQALAKIKNFLNSKELNEKVADILANNASVVDKQAAAQKAYNAALATATTTNTQIDNVIKILKQVSTAGAAGTAASGLAGKAAGAVKGAAGAARDKFRDFVPSKTFKTVSQQIKDLQPADKQKLVSILKQELATA
jgi:hypothetical protein